MAAVSGVGRERERKVGVRLDLDRYGASSGSFNEKGFENRAVYKNGNYDSNIL